MKFIYVNFFWCSVDASPSARKIPTVRNKEGDIRDADPMQTALAAFLEKSSI